MAKEQGLENTTSVTAVTLVRFSETTINSLVTDMDLIIFDWIVLSFLSQAIDIFGIVTNVINIMCFARQGFEDAVNMSLIGLAISDISCLATLMWTNICLTPAFSELDLPFDAFEIQYLTSGMLHVTFTRVTGWITALITVERCLCVTIPLKVKSLFTSRRMVVFTIGIFVVLLSSVAPFYVVNRLAPKWSPIKNKTVLGIVFTADRENVEKVSFAINNGFIPISAFMVIIFCTTTIVIKLKVTTEWSKRSTSSLQAQSISNRNRKVSKMVVIISVMFISCFIPVSIGFIAMTLIPELSVSGKYKNLLVMIAGLGFVLESVHSSANIFVYYNMSSKYQQTFNRLFCKNMAG